MKKQLLIMTLLLLGMVVLSACQGDEAVENTAPPKVDLKTETPIILIHGSGGDTHSLDEIADHLMNDFASSKEEMSMSISADGDITYQGALTKDAHRPIIKLGFDKNQADPDKWAEWLHIAAADLKTRYGFSHMDGVGHSNGGLALTYFAENYSKDKSVPTLRKLIAIGSPFNDLDADDNASSLNFQKLPAYTKQMTYFMDNKTKLNSDLEVLSIAGKLSDVGEATDGIVPTNSSLASRLFMPQNAKVYIENLQVGDTAVHQTLHETPESIEQVYWFLENFHSEKSITKLVSE
ncbi:alpha/beta hydrolase [Listeria seeligeri]|uniref:alpha/beta hydrolase n=1 Tax=Listeria seeligeri TaxID=1640 RepID=UPI0019454811|nr:alpha/beta hydrolase [Listeria seeligeri]MBM5597975.1 alpha/beta hydrolase [Listeria seeligeri]